MDAQVASDRVITTRLRALADCLPAVLDGEPEGVHKARVASRRVREALPVVLAQAPPGRTARLRRSFRRVTRALGPLREIDATCQLLTERMANDPRAAAALGGLVRRLQKERAERRDEMLSRLDAIDFESLVHRIERLMDERADEGDEARALPLAIEGTLGVRIARRVRALEVAVSRAGETFAPGRLHRVRIAIKKLRYALELAHDMKVLRSRRPLTVLRDAQQALGRLRDEQVFGDWMRRFARDHAESDAVVGETLAALNARSLALHARYLEVRPRLVAAADQALGAVLRPRSPKVEEIAPAAGVH